VYKSTKGGEFILSTFPQDSFLRLPVGRSTLLFKGRRGGGEASKGVVRGKYPSAMRIKRKGEETTLEYVIHPEFGGVLPAFVTNRTIGNNLAYLTTVQEYFQALRGLVDFDTHDGKALGERLVLKTGSEQQRRKVDIEARMRELVAKYQGLQEIVEKYEFFLPMITRVLENKLRSAEGVHTKLFNVSEREGAEIGAGLAMALAANLTAEAGVDQWMRGSRSLQELDRTEVWFRPLMFVVGKRLLGEVSWGLKLRVCTGAGLSVLDLATDIYIITQYWGSEATKSSATSLLYMVVGSIVCQMLLVLAQNNKNKNKMALVKEMLVVVTGLKPALDAMRVVGGTEMEEHNIFELSVEHAFTKSIEMVFESIPGCLLQQFVLLKNRELISSSTVGSVLISAITTGFTSASLSFDFDVDPTKRKEHPEFYGYFPDGASR